MKYLLARVYSAVDIDGASVCVDISNKTAPVTPEVAQLSDAEFKEILKAARRCCVVSESSEARSQINQQLGQQFTSPTNANHVLPCLSVRTGFDLFLLASSFAPGSEIIMSAVNIPSMTAIAERHELKVIPLDISIDTLAPKHHLLESLITERTVAVVVAHIYGCVLDVSGLINACRHHGLWFVEDCAEAFGGLHYLGHPLADISLFSFGVIKFCTAFGGAVAKVRDADLYRRMRELHESFPTQSGTTYLRKLCKYAVIFLFLNSPRFMSCGMAFGKSIGWDYQNTVVDYLRGFKGDALNGLRCRPSVALLTTLHQRLGGSSELEFLLTKSKARYVVERLEGHVTVAGWNVAQRNYWLFPVVVHNAQRFCSLLNHMGVDAYRGATQLDVILPDNHPHLHSCTNSGNDTTTQDSNRSDQIDGSQSNVSSWIQEDIRGGRTTAYFASSISLESAVGSDVEFACDKAIPETINAGMEDNRREYSAPSGNFGGPVPTCCARFPSEAKYLIDHVVYLPVHKNVPYKCLDQICEAVKLVGHVCNNIGSPDADVWLKSKL